MTLEQMHASLEITRHIRAEAANTLDAQFDEAYCYPSTASGKSCC